MRNVIRNLTCAALALFALRPFGLPAATPTSPTAELAASTQPLVVAVVEFVTQGEPIEKDGEKIQAMLTAYLTADPSLRLVERKDMEKILQEQKLSLSGLVDEQQTIQIGRLVGAKVMIMGRGFLVNDSYTIVAKTVGTETGRVFADMVQGDHGDGLTNLVSALAEKIGATIRKNRDVLAAPPKTKENRVAAINKALGKLARPGVIVSCAERHIGRPVIDPAVETEVNYLLTACGFKVIEKKDWDSGPWLAAYLKDPKTPVPSAVKKSIDVLIVGEAFSEFGARMGDLVSCRARVEIKAIDRRTGEILAIDRETATALDLAENIAAKKAIQDATVRLAERMIPAATRKWNKIRGKSKNRF